MLGYKPASSEKQRKQQGNLLLQPCLRKPLLLCLQTKLLQPDTLPFFLCLSSTSQLPLTLFVYFQTLAACASLPYGLFYLIMQSQDSFLWLPTLCLFTPFLSLQHCALLKL